jgi:LPXTG-site transpeptidase (sortase) family protein
MIGRRRIAGFALLVAGGLLFSFAGGRYALGAVAQDEARRTWDETNAHLALAAAQASVFRDRGLGAIVEGAPVARLVIPKIGLDEIVLEGVSDRSMNGGPGHFPGSALPGEAGNAIISAHRDRHFRHFDNLTIGDTIQTESGARAATWVIVARRVVDKDAPALFPSQDATLTLTTCWPIRYLGSAPDRLVLTAKPVARRKPS